MRCEDDTIAAIATPLGPGGIGIVRISGPQSLEIAEKLFSSRNKSRISRAESHKLMYGHISGPAEKGMIDEVLVAVMKAPHSYTKEDSVEIQCHGGMVAVRKVLEAVIAEGARLADPGEFTRRAFLNGRISLDQAEAVLDLITARTEESLRVALEQLRGGLSERLSDMRTRLIETRAFVEAYIDFPEDEIEVKTDEQLVSRIRGIRQELESLSQTFQEARFFREGLSVAIIGRPNVGKSSLLNSLLKRDRAIVTEFPGTTRDIIEECLDINGLPVRIIDTAGIRESHELAEQEGIRRSMLALEQADFVIAMIDGSRPLDENDRDLLERIRTRHAVIAVNKADLPARTDLAIIREYGKQYVSVSAVSGSGLEELKEMIFASHLKDWREEREGVVVTNLRHKTALDRAAASLAGALEMLSGNQPLEIVAIELREAADQVGSIIGTVTAEDVLDRIFSDFCIGK